jgi:hypothetical protein
LGCLGKTFRSMPLSRSYQASERVCMYCKIIIFCDVLLGTMHFARKSIERSQKTRFTRVQHALNCQALIFALLF